MSIRYEKPEAVRLEITCGDWLLVKKRLTAGENMRMMSWMLKDDRNQIEPVNVGLSKLMTYVIDWSIQGVDEKIVAIADQDDATRKAAFTNLPSHHFGEILAAVESHEKAQDKAREAEKNAQDGGNASSPISPSLAPLGGDTATSKTSTLMSIAS